MNRWYIVLCTYKININLGWVDGADAGHSL